MPDDTKAFRIMASAKKSSATKNGTKSFFDTLWDAADEMRGHMDPAEYKHVALGLIFLKYISDSFEEKYAALKAEPHADPEDRDEYTADNIFWVPQEARWPYLQANAKNPKIGQMLDVAMIAIEKANPALKDVLPKSYGLPALDPARLGRLIDHFANIALGDTESRAKDILGQVYEYFLGKFASAEGKGGGEYYTPQVVVRLLVEMLEPYKGRVYDPCCGSGGMFVQSERFVQSHQGRINDISIYGQESNPTTWRLCQMNLAIRGIVGNIGPQWGDSFHNDLHKDLKADFVLANPPFNISIWGGENLRADVRWKYGIPPVGNANFAWVQHIIHHLAPNGMAGFVLANGSMSSATNGEGDTRKAIIEADLVDCMIALPDRLFRTTQIPACLWFVSRNKADSRYRDRRGHTLFIDARKMGTLEDRVHRFLSDDEILHIANTYHAWRGEASMGEYADVAGFCKNATIAEIAENKYVLTPGRYVGAQKVVGDDEPFEEKMARLTATLTQQFAESARLEQAIAENLRGLGYGE